MPLSAEKEHAVRRLLQTTGLSYSEISRHLGVDRREVSFVASSLQPCSERRGYHEGQGGFPPSALQPLPLFQPSQQSMDAALLYPWPCVQYPFAPPLAVFPPPPSPPVAQPCNGPVVAGFSATYLLLSTLAVAGLMLGRRTTGLTGPTAAAGPPHLPSDRVMELFSFTVDSAFLRGAPRTAALAATVTMTGDGLLHLVTATTSHEQQPGVRLLANGRGAMEASLEAGYLWMRTNWDRVCREYGPLAGQGGPFPGLEVAVTSLWEKDQGSMGGAFVIAMLAALLDRAVRRDVAVCAEVDVLGGLWPVGGVAGKVKALAQVGVTTVLVARRSTSLDLRRLGVQLVMCDTIWDVLGRCFLPKPNRRRGLLDQAAAGWALSLDRDRIIMAGDEDDSMEDPYFPSIQCTIVLTPDPTSTSPSDLTWRLTAPQSRCVPELVRLAFRLVLSRLDRWGPRQVQLPVPSGMRGEAVFHVAPVTMPGYPDQRQYGLAIAVALISALTGRKPRPRVVSIAELATDGRALPLADVEGERDVTYLMVAGQPVSKLLLHHSGVNRMRRAVAKHGSRELREGLQVVGITGLEDGVKEALEE